MRHEVQYGNTKFEHKHAVAQILEHNIGRLSMTAIKFVDDFSKLPQHHIKIEIQYNTPDKAVAGTHVD